MSRPAEELLEFDGLRQLVRGYTTCAPGRADVEQLAFSRDAAALDAAFARIGEAMAYLRAGSELGFGALADPAGWLARLDSPGSVLTPAEILDAASLLDTSAWLKQAFRGESAKYPLLAARVGGLADFRSLAAAIRKAILPNGEVSDDASPELKRIRQNIGRARDKIQKTLNALLRARGRSETPGDDYITIRNDRYVIPVRAGDRRSVEGVVHGSSATGQTVFVEPLETIELNNKLVQLAEDEAGEIARILAELTERLRGDLGPLRVAAAAIAEMDSTFARARFAREFDCTLPRFGTSGSLRLKNARHPVLEANLRRAGRSIVPMTLALGDGDSVLVISGPNTGGKTVALKSAGLAALAAQSGIPVAAEEAELPMVDRVLADIGDEQSITADLSTFSAHMLNLRAMLDTATPESLVLVDEIGTGTAPEEGAALAVALLEEFRARGCLTLATTHHDRLKTYASTTPGILNAAVEFDAVNLRPTYRLIVGLPGVSSGIDIAARLGVPPTVVERARTELDPATREAAGLIAWLHRSRDELEEIKRQAAEQLAQLEDERRKLRTEWTERQRARLAELEKQFAAVVKKYEAEIQRLVGDIKDRELRARAEKQSGRRLQKIRADAREEANAAAVAHLSESQQDLGVAGAALAEPVALERLVAGARLQVRGFKQPVVLRQHDGRTAEVQAGPLRMKIALSDITAVVVEETPGQPVVGARHGVPAPAAKAGARAPLAAPRDAGRVTVRAQASAETVPDEINVIGCTVEEATGRVDKFLDDAALAGKPRVRIIHGHGTGALRSGIAEFLATHPLVESFAHEAADRGGTAITVVELRT